MMTTPPTIDDIRRAAERIAPFAHRTPVMRAESLDEITGARIWFKCENLQKVGAFKFRGACNAVMSLRDEEAERGVATHSSGNHAAALALAARRRGIAASIVMPSNAPAIKKSAVAGYGARIHYCEPTLAAREETLAEVIRMTGASEIHPYNDYRIIAGQATAALELLEQVPDLDLLIAPVGGGGLLSGTALSVRAIRPQTQVIGVEPTGADDAYRSMQAGYLIPSLSPQTICDGLLTSLGDKTFPIIQQHVDRILTAEDNVICRAMRHIWERMKIIVEPSAAVALAVVLQASEDFRGATLGIILSGGNLDLDHLPWQS